MFHIDVPYSFTKPLVDIVGYNKNTFPKYTIKYAKKT